MLDQAVVEWPLVVHCQLGRPAPALLQEVGLEPVVEPLHSLSSAGLNRMPIGHGVQAAPAFRPVPFSATRGAHLVFSRPLLLPQAHQTLLASTLLVLFCGSWGSGAGGYVGRLRTMSQMPQSLRNKLSCHRWRLGRGRAGSREISFQHLLVCAICPFLLSPPLLVRATFPLASLSLSICLQVVRCGPPGMRCQPY